MSRRQFRKIMTRLTQLSARRRLSRAAHMQLCEPGEVPAAADLQKPRTESGEPNATAEMQCHALNIWEDEGGATHLQTAEPYQRLN